VLAVGERGQGVDDIVRERLGVGARVDGGLERVVAPGSSLRSSSVVWWERMWTAKIASTTPRIAMPSAKPASTSVIQW